MRKGGEKDKKTILMRKMKYQEQNRNHCLKPYTCESVSCDAGSSNAGSNEIDSNEETRDRDSSWLWLWCVLDWPPRDYDEFG